MIEHAAHNRKRLSRNLRFVAGALSLLFVMHFAFPFASGGLRSDSPAESAPEAETVQQVQFERPASYPVGSAARISENRLVSDRVGERKSGTGGDVPPSDRFGITSDWGVATDAVRAAPRRPLYHIHRALLI